MTRLLPLFAFVPLAWPGACFGQSAAGPARPAAGSLPYPRGCYAMVRTDAPIPAAVLSNRALVGVYLQFTWRAIEKQPGRYQWANLDARIQEAEAAGLKVVLSLRAGLYGAPNWIKNNPQVRTVHLTDTNRYHRDTYGKLLTLPVFWDPIFHEARRAFIRAAGRRYAGRDSVVAVTTSFANYFTDDWAVPHQTAKGGRGARAARGATDQVRQWQSAGYSHERMFAMGREILDETAAAFPRQNLKLPIGVTHPRMDPTATALATRILDYAYRKYPTRFYAQFNQLQTKTPRASDAAVDAANPNERPYLFQLLRRYSPQIGIQMLAAASNGDKDGCRQNGNEAPCPAEAVLQKSVDIGLSYHPVFFEFWREDAENPELVGVLKKATEGVGGTLR